MLRLDAWLARASSRIWTLTSTIAGLRPTCREYEPAIQVMDVEYGYLHASRGFEEIGRTNPNSPSKVAWFRYDLEGEPDLFRGILPGGEHVLPQTDSLKIAAGRSRLAHAVRHVRLPAAGTLQRLVVGMNGASRPPSSMMPARPAREFTLAVPDTAPVAGVLHVTFRFPTPVSRQEAGINRDTRRLAIAFQAVSFPTETGSKQGSSTKRRADRLLEVDQSPVGSCA